MEEGKVFHNLSPHKYCCLVGHSWWMNDNLHWMDCSTDFAENVKSVEPLYSSILYTMTLISNKVVTPRISDARYNFNIHDIIQCKKELLVSFRNLIFVIRNGTKKIEQYQYNSFYSIRAILLRKPLKHVDYQVQYWMSRALECIDNLHSTL